jgi:hypothetical protein
MTIKQYTFLFLVLIGGLSVAYGAEGGTPAYSAIILYQGAPNPTPDKCLIRTYLPESDPNSSLRILNSDSSLFKEIPLAGQVGITSTPIDASDWKAGTYLYQLFYKGETRSTMSFTVKH